MSVALLLYIIALILAVIAPFVPQPRPYTTSAALVLVIIASIIEAGVKL